MHYTGGKADSVMGGLGIEVGVTDHSSNPGSENPQFSVCNNMPQILPSTTPSE